MSQSSTSLSKSRSSDKATPSAEEPNRTEWLERLDGVHLHRTDLNRLVMDYLVTEGFKEAADKFRLEAGVVPPVPLDSLDERIRIRDCLQEGRVLEAVALLNGLRPELLDNDRCLLFHLPTAAPYRTHPRGAHRGGACVCPRPPQRVRRREPSGRSRVLSELERTLALLAFEEPQSSPFGDLLHPSQRQKVASEVNAALLEDQSTTRPQLSVMLRLLLWAQDQLEQLPPGGARLRFPRVTQLADPFPQQ
ncbi:hypothetical protein MTO96_051428 [Rhipicephalus appendiculatus]